MKNRILIIDDHKAFRETLRSFIEKNFKDIEIKEASSAEEGIEVAIKEKPQIALVDIQLPKMDGIQAAQQIKRFIPTCQILTMSMFRAKDWKFPSHAGIDFMDKNEIDVKLIPVLRKMQFS